MSESDFIEGLLAEPDNVRLTRDKQVALKAYQKEHPYPSSTVYREKDESRRRGGEQRSPSEEKFKHLQRILKHNERLNRQEERERTAQETDRFFEEARLTDPSSDSSTAPETPTGTAREATETTGRRRGQALTEEEKKEYQRIIKVAKQLKLPHHLVGKKAKIAAAARVDLDVVSKAIKWGLKHGHL